MGTVPSKNFALVENLYLHSFMVTHKHWKLCLLFYYFYFSLSKSVSYLILNFYVTQSSRVFLTYNFFCSKIKIKEKWCKMQERKKKCKNVSVSTLVLLKKMNKRKRKILIFTKNKNDNSIYKFFVYLCLFKSEKKRREFCFLRVANKKNERWIKEVHLKTHSLD
jgi:hypothetical protein